MTRSQYSQDSRLALTDTHHRCEGTQRADVSATDGRHRAEHACRPSLHWRREAGLLRSISHSVASAPWVGPARRQGPRAGFTMRLPADETITHSVWIISPPCRAMSADIRLSRLSRFLNLSGRRERVARPWSWVQAIRRFPLIWDRRFAKSIDIGDARIMSW